MPKPAMDRTSSAPSDPLKYRVLSIDPGLKCGYAITDGPEVRVQASENYGPGIGVHKLKSSRFEGAGMPYLRLRRFLAAVHPHEVYFEEVRRHAGTTAAHVYGAIIGTIMTWCEETGVPYTSIPVQSIKRFATGKGNASKEMMIKTAQDRLHYPGNDNDEADALWILALALEKHLYDYYTVEQQPLAKAKKKKSQ